MNVGDRFAARRASSSAERSLARSPAKSGSPSSLKHTSRYVRGRGAARSGVSRPRPSISHSHRVCSYPGGGVSPGMSGDPDQYAFHHKLRRTAVQPSGLGVGRR